MIELGLHRRGIRLGGRKAEGARSGRGAPQPTPSGVRGSKGGCLRRPRGCAGHRQASPCPSGPGRALCPAAVRGRGHLRWTGRAARPPRGWGRGSLTGYEAEGLRLPPVPGAPRSSPCPGEPPAAGAVAAAEPPPAAPCAEGLLASHPAPSHAGAVGCVCGVRGGGFYFSFRRRGQRCPLFPAGNPRGSAGSPQRAASPRPARSPERSTRTRFGFPRSSPAPGRWRRGSQRPGAPSRRPSLSGARRVRAVPGLCPGSAPAGSALPGAAGSSAGGIGTSERPQRHTVGTALRSRSGGNPPSLPYKATAPAKPLVPPDLRNGACRQHGVRAVCAGSGISVYPNILTYCD